MWADAEAQRTDRGDGTLLRRGDPRTGSKEPTLKKRRQLLVPHEQGTGSNKLSDHRSKVERLQDVATGSPTVVRLVVRFYRNGRGQSALREILGRVVQDVLQDKTLSIHTDPVHVYKSWVNQTEAQTGQRR